MAVATLTNRIVYLGDGATTAFPYPFRIFDDTDLVVTEVLIASPFTETVKTLTTEYTVSGAGDATGGTVTMLTAPAATVKLVIERNVPKTQAVTYVDNEAEPAGTINDALDKLTMLAQQLGDELDRAIKLDITQDISLVSAFLPPPEASQALAWNSDADALENVTSPGSAAAEAEAAAAEAATSATAAETSATAATVSASAAASSATSAAASATAAAASAASITISLDAAYDGGATATVDAGAFTLSGSHASNETLRVNQTNAAATGDVVRIDSDGVGRGLYVSVDKLTTNYGVYFYSNAAQTVGPLLFVEMGNASSTVAAVGVINYGAAAAITLTTSNAGGCPLFLGLRSSSTFATEGGLYADTEDGILYYRSSANWRGCNTDGDFSETFGVKGKTDDYEEGDVVVISAEKVTQEKKDEIRQQAQIKKDKTDVNEFDEFIHSDRKETRLLATALKIEKSSFAYQTSIMGVVCYRSVKNWTSMDEIPIGLLGKVPCKVCDENGAIMPGDLLVPSSTAGHAMRGTIDTFAKIGSIIGKAREPFVGVQGKIEIAIGIR